MHRSNKGHKDMKKHEDIYVAAVGMYKFAAVNAFTLVKHKHKAHTHG